MGYMLSLLLYGCKIIKETGSWLIVSWSKQGNLIYFIGKLILINAIRAIIYEMIINIETLLWIELIFKKKKSNRDNIYFIIPLANIKDNLI